MVARIKFCMPFSTSPRSVLFTPVLLHLVKSKINPYPANMENMVSS